MPPRRPRDGDQPPSRLRVARQALPPSEPAPEPQVDPDTRLLTPSTIDTLRAAGVLDHWAGRAAIVAARHIDTECPPGAPLAALLKAHRDSMRAAMEAVEASGDVLDEIFRRSS